MGDTWPREDDAVLYRAVAPDLIRYATVLVGPADAPDTVAEAVVSAMTSARWPDVENKRSYLFKSTLHKAQDHLRSTTSRRRREQVYARDNDRLRAQLDPFDWDGGARHEVVEAMLELSTRQRAAVYLAYWEDLSAETVAEHLDISEGAVRKHLARGRAHLRERLSDLYPIEPTNVAASSEETEHPR